MFGLDHMGCIVTTWYNLHTGRLFGCNCLLKKKLWDGAHLHYFPYSKCTFFSQPSCKPVVLNKYVLMFGLHHMGCIVSVCILSGCLVAIACLKYGSEMVRTANLHSFPYSNCMTFVQPSCKPVILDKLLFICIRLLCVCALPVLYCALHHAHTPESAHVLMDGLHPKVFFSSENTFVIYWSFIIIVHIVVYLQSIETDRCFLWLVSIFYLHQFLPATLQTSDIVQTNLQMHEVSDTYRPMLKCSFILCIILYCTIYIYTYIYIYICCLFIF